MYFTIQVISDTIYPWCYIGSRQLNHGIAQYKRKHPQRNDDFKIIWRPFYLNVQTPKGSFTKRDVYINRLGEERGNELMDRISKAGAAVGIKFLFRGLAGHCRDSHRLIHFARASGPDVQTRLANEIFRSYFEEDEDITEQPVLINAAKRAGLDEVDARMCLTEQAEIVEIDQEVAQAREAGVSGVPHFILNDKFEVSGAQESLAFVQLFERLTKLDERSKA